MSRNIVVIERRREGESASRAQGGARRPPWGARFVLAFLALVGCLPLSADSVYHILQKGETLFSLSREYNVPVDAIESANRISDPSLLQVGKRLLIPSLHRVLRGETLYSIARLYDTSVEALRAANRLDAESILKVGDLLFIPSAPRKKDSGSAAGSAAASAQASAAQASPAAPKGAAAAARPPSTGTIALSPQPDTPGAAVYPSADPSIDAPRGRDPPAVRISSRAVDLKLSWPCKGEANYMDGKLFGIMFRPRKGDPETAIASGTVVSAGPYRGFGQVVFVQGRGGFIYVYGGNESITVRVGDKVLSGQELGRVGVDAKEGRPTPVAYFFVFKNGEALDPALAPRN